MPAPQQGLRFDLNRPDSLNDVLRRLTDLGKGRKVIENSIMRDMSHSAAQRLVPVVEAGIQRSPAPQARAVAGTVRAKRDRMIVVQAGATNPKLSGVKRNSRNKFWRGSLAWGVAVGPGPRRGPVDATTEPRPALITPSIDPRLTLAAPSCHPWMLVSALAIYANGDAVYRCPACHHQWRLGYSPDYLRGTRL